METIPFFSPSGFRSTLLRLLTGLLVLVVIPLKAAEEYEVGGPLAGVKLPLFPNSFGGPAGHPGCLPDGKFSSKCGLSPQRELYPDSVEHFHSFNFKYTPARSFFDRQSQIKNWTAPQIPLLRQGSEGQAGTDAKRVEPYAEPVYWLGRGNEDLNTGKKKPPVSVVRCGIKNPVVQLDLGELEVGLYAVRVIGAVETAKLRPWREPLFITMKVNDGLKGEVSTYRIRCGYVDEFYSVVEIYFHATEKRRFQAELFVDEGSTVDLLVHNVSLDNALAGATRRPIKKARTYYTGQEIAALKTPLTTGQQKMLENWKFTSEERLKRDEAFWKWLPPLNAQGLGDWAMGALTVGKTTLGTADKTGEEIAAQQGTWDFVRDKMFDDNFGWTFFRDLRQSNALMINKKLNLAYTTDDLHARKPLPDPYPYQDDGAGFYYPDPKELGNGRILAPIASAVGQRLRDGWMFASKTADFWLCTGNPEFARDAAVSLIRFAYQYPTIEAGNFIGSVIRQPGFLSMDVRCRRRCLRAYWMSDYANYLQPLYLYDKLFPFIKGNEELAKSIQRFIPWVKNSDDLVALLDTYLVQHEAKRILRYQEVRDDVPAEIVEVATLLGDPAVTDPWMEWGFSRAFRAPLPLAGIQDLMIVGCDRSGSTYIGSTSYGMNGSSALDLERYLRTGGNPKFDLTTFSYKPLAHCHWHLDMLLGGLYAARMGDVAGPGMYPGWTMRKDTGFSTEIRAGWRWSKDPQFAWTLAHYLGRAGETDAEWKEIEAAAAQQKRAPWLENRSRFVPGWFAGLESGTEHDDFRFRRAVYVRSGITKGHNHSDTLDLQVIAHGLHMTVDGGARGGYSKPNDNFTRIHNLVEVDGKNHLIHSWPSSIADAPGARYLQMEGDYQNLYRRQVALVDVDEGKGSQKLPPPQQIPGAKLPAGVVTANSYVFDVFRVAGGQKHNYCFHGPIDDDCQWNAEGVKPVEHVKVTPSVNTEAEYLSIFEHTPESKLAGNAPEVLEATFRHARTDTKSGGGEAELLQGNFDPNSPRKFTRWHLLGAKGSRALRAQVDMHKAGYRWTAMMLSRPSNNNQESAFVALVEPYVGEPFIAGRRLLDISSNENDARRAVAAEVKLKNGRTDILFADGRPEKTREFQISNFKSQISGEFACYSTDAQGLQQATLAGGTLLSGPAIQIKTSVRQRTAQVVAADYHKRTLTINEAWEGTLPDRLFEVGVEGHWTAYTPVKIETKGQTTVLTLDRGADFYRSEITQVLPGENRVDASLGFSVPGIFRGEDQKWVASNEPMTKFWRADRTGNSSFVLSGEPVKAEAFAPENVLRLWEYGVGDTVRQSTFAGVRRIEPGVYEVTGDVDLEVTLAGRPPQKITAAQLAAGNGKVRLTTRPAGG